MSRFSNRMDNVPKSYVREILKVAEKPGVISFAGGLPNPDFFPVKEITEATTKVLSEDGASVLQYSTTEGYLPLRQYIVDRYYKGMGVTEDNILITNGSQQALDLLGKAFIDSGDKILLEKPGYLGAIQSFYVFQPEFLTAELEDDGIHMEQFEQEMEKDPKLFYAVTNFQNPSGVSYSLEKRKQIAEILKRRDVYMVDDNPYMELRFDGQPLPSMKELAGDKVIALGSFSKIFAPSMRLGWVCACNEVMEKLVILKQAADLHTNYFSQRVLYQYLSDYHIDDHIERICDVYKEKRDYMLEMIQKYVDESVTYTRPEGGMFIWMRIPEHMDLMEVLHQASERNMAFVPGKPFYINEESDPGNTLRLNYTNSSKEDIEKGVKALAEAIDMMLK